VSYCRWSCLDFKSDVYVYANVSGAWTIHVAGNRCENTPPLRYEYPEEHKRYSDDRRLSFTLTPEGAAAWRKWENENNRRFPIELPHAGETFDTSDPGECADKLQELADLGYCVPDWVIPDLRAEQADMDAPESRPSPDKEGV
jgi:hypothetical protein